MYIGIYATKIYLEFKSYFRPIFGGVKNLIDLQLCCVDSFDSDPAQLADFDRRLPGRAFGKVGFEHDGWGQERFK